MSFGSNAALYDRARPSYPKALIDDLMAPAPRDVLDVGCGTGKAGRLLVERGCTVTGVEPDPAMAEVARSHGLMVEPGTFETWEPGDRRFDLLTAGQSWHWVDPAVGPTKAAAVLRPGGQLALFWNVGTHQPQAQAALDEVYQRLAPGIALSTTALGHHDRDERERVAPSVDSLGFQSVVARTYPWDERYSRQAWLDFLSTHSDHAGLPAAQRAALLSAVGATIDELGGSLTFHFQTALVLATL
jgi:SAM-dependent methyltransferase